MRPFAASHDLFGDGSVRLFELPGHAAGHLGALAQTGPGEQKFLVADAAYTTAAIRRCAPPHAVTRLYTDSFGQQQATLQALNRFMEAHPRVEIIPSHCPEVAERYDFGRQLAAAVG